MSQRGPEHDLLEQRCQDAVAVLIERHNWQLLDREAFARRAVEALRSGLAADPGRAAIYVYSRALYTACSGIQGSDRQNLGYTELFQYLYDNAYRRCPSVRDDAAQRAIERVYISFGQCRQPGAFFAFAIHQLMNAAKALRRQQARQPLSLDRPLGQASEALSERLADERAGDLAGQAITGELKTRFERLAQEFRLKYPRASDQLAALWLKYFEGLDDIAIGRQLGKSVKSVYVLRFRAIEKLRAEPSWKALAIDCGILPEDDQLK
jgi:RNA polymerase sigma factor (sigma-70 family)